MPQVQQHPATLTLGLLLLLVLAAIVVAMGFSMGIVILLIAILGFAFAFRYTYVSLYAAIAMAPFLGAMVSISTGTLTLGERAFGGSIDVSLAEVMMMFVIAAWGMKLILYWWRRRDQQWVPRLPLVQSYAALFFAHLASTLSPLQPDPALVVKYAFRPVLFNYLAFVAVPVNLIRSRKRLASALLVVSAVGTFAAANGLYAMFFDHSAGALIGRAHPSAIFGVNALGENHNELADILVFTWLATLAASRFVKHERLRRLLIGATVFQFGIGLLTFTRTYWIMVVLQGAFLYWHLWREAAQRHLRSLAVVGVLLLPLIAGMISYAASDSASSSNSTRLMLSEIALQLFVSSPVLGAGAGTFVERVGSTYVFRLEYGDPLDSHGFLQKLMAETGLFGLAAMAFVYIQLTFLLYQGWKSISSESARHTYALLIAACYGALGYQLFNTDYWSAKMWLPVGLVLAAAAVLKEVPRDILEP